MMKPGTYTVTLYQGELEAGSGSVTVTAGGTSSINLSSSLNRPNTIWSIGRYFRSLGKERGADNLLGTVDGTPAG